MNIELEMLKAQFDSLRTVFLSLLPCIMDEDKKEGGGRRTWANKFLLWSFERENLSALAKQPGLASRETAVIDRRCFQLQVLMDVAYIQGGLQGFDKPRLILPDDRDIADRVFYNSDGSEEDMVRVIDSMF